MAYVPNERGYIRCPFCGKYPGSIQEVYPLADDRVSCNTKDCPGSGTWVPPEKWNARADLEALDRGEQ